MRKIQITLQTDDPDLINICSAYWELNTAGEFIHKTTDLAKNANVRVYDITQWAKEYSKVFFEEIVCDSCEQPRPVQSRADYSSAQSYWTCDDCIDAQREEERIQHEIELDERREKVLSVYGDVKRAEIPIETLSLSHAVYLLSLMRFALSEDTSYLKPIDYCTGSFTPQYSYGVEILRQLYQNESIYVDADSESEAFCFKNGDPESFYITKVSWVFPSLTLSDGKNVHPLNGLTQFLQGEKWPSNWANQRLELWKEVALNETIEYLVVKLDEHGLPFNPGEKTKMLLSQILENFSVSQCYNFIWRASRDAAAYYARERISRQQAANSVVGSIQRYSERAKAEGWDIKGYQRDFKCPRTILSEVTFDLALDIGENGFKLPPKEEYLPPRN